MRNVRAEENRVVLDRVISFLQEDTAAKIYKDREEEEEDAVMKA